MILVSTSNRNRPRSFFSSDDLTVQVITIRMSDRKFEQMTGTDSTTSLLQELIGQMLLRMHMVAKVFRDRRDP